MSSEEYKIQPDENEIRMEKRRKESEAFTAKIELEKSMRDLRKQIQVGTHMMRATAEMIDAMLLDDLEAMVLNRSLMKKIMAAMDAISEVQEALDDE